MQPSIRESWSSRFAFIAVSMGATVGLGNLWRFPTEAGNNGGGAFVIVYLIAVFAFAVHLFIAETVIGRLGQQSVPNTLRSLAKKAGATEKWRYAGWMALVTSILVLSFFSVVAGFSLGYIERTLTGALANADAATVQTTFAAFLANPYELFLWHSLFALATILVVGLGIRSGIERIGKILMPALFAILIGLVIYAGLYGDFGAAVSYLFGFQWQDFTPAIILAALGQAFFTMSIGSGGIMTYGAYIGRPIPIGRSAMTVAFGDTAVALLAGLAIFPLVFANNVDPAEGSGLIFVTLPIAFGGMPFGQFVGFAFYILFVFAAITSTIGLLETLVSYFEESGRFSRMKIAFGLGGLFWIAGILSVLSFNILADFYPLSFLSRFHETNIFDLLGFLISNVLLLAGGLLFSIFAGWVLSRSETMQELGLGEGLYNYWRFMVRYGAPAVILLLFAINLIG